jgi:protein-S-isoprenylcysteine O-methyltransferase Ste14
MMDTARRFLAIVLLVSTPPAIAFWLVIHPFARWWRRLPAWLTYLLLAGFVVALGVRLFVMRDVLLGRDLGGNWWLATLGGTLYVGAVVVSLRCREQLSLKVFAGIPEVSRTAGPGQMLQEGIYGMIRHPRYLSVILGTVGLALIVNYLGAYAVVGVSLLGLWPLILLEERELTARFGQAYAEYRARTPALLPRYRKIRGVWQG